MLLAGAYFRLVGINWGEYQFLHPDERFLVWVGSDISPVKCLNPDYSIYDCPVDQKGWMAISEYFDTVNSTLNPNNRGHGFYVYGTLPMFFTRYAVEWVYGHSGFNEMTNIGRVLSALADLLTVYLAFAIASRLYDRRVGLLAAAFSAAAVMMIQQSHFFSMEPFLNFFIYLAIYFAVRIARLEWQPRIPEAVEAGGNPGEPEIAYNTSATEAVRSEPDSLTSSLPQARSATAPSRTMTFLRSPLFLLSLGFGLAPGLCGCLETERCTGGALAARRVCTPVASSACQPALVTPGGGYRIFGTGSTGQPAGFPHLSAVCIQRAWFPGNHTQPAMGR